MRIIFKLIFLITLIFFGLSITAFADSNKIKKRGVVITKIRAKSIDVRRKVETITLSGNVVVERDDVSITADNMLIYYFEDKANQKKVPEKISSNIYEGTQAEQNIEKKQLEENQLSSDKAINSTIKKIEAINNVKVFNDEFVATGTYGFYNANQNNIILEKNVTFNNGTSLIDGEKFVYDLKTKKGNMVGTKDSTKTINNKSDSEDGRVIVIIDDNTVKKSQKPK